MKSDTITARVPKRRKYAVALLDEHQNDYAGGHDLTELLTHPWALVLKREDDAAVYGVDGPDDVAAFELDREGDEWVEGVYDLDTGDEVTYSTRTTVEVTFGDGRTAAKSDR